MNRLISSFMHGYSSIFFLGDIAGVLADTQCPCLSWYLPPRSSACVSWLLPRWLFRSSTLPCMHVAAFSIIIVCFTMSTCKWCIQIAQPRRFHFLRDKSCILSVLHFQSYQQDQVKQEVNPFTGRFGNKFAWNTFVASNWRNKSPMDIEDTRYYIGQYVHRVRISHT